MDSIGGLLLAALIWLLPAILGALKRKREKQEGAASPPPPPRAQEAEGGETDPTRRRARAAVAALEKAQGLAARAPHAELESVLRAELEEARGLESRLSSSDGSGATAAPDASDRHARVKALHERAGLLLRLCEGRLDPKTGALVRGLASAVEQAVPGMRRRALVLRGGEHERGGRLRAGSPLLPLTLAGRPERRPWALAALVEDAWAAELLDDAAAIDAATERAAAEGSTDDPMERFASALAQAWAPALLLDAACTLSLGGGHVARVRALLDEEAPADLFVVRLDSAQRVESVPPAGLRLMLLRRLLERQGGPIAPPLPPNPVLQLRGPGVWDQVALAPVLDHAAGVQFAFAQDLASRDGLQQAAQVSEQAAALLQGAAEGKDLPRSEARVLFAAAGLSAALPVEPTRTARLLEALSGPQVGPSRGAASGARRRAARASSAPVSRRRVMREAILLGEAFGGRRG